MPAPFVFVVVVAVTMALIIFFGAWAVSASEEGRELNFGLTGATLDDSRDDSSPNSSGGGQQSSAAFGSAPIGETSGGASGTWWGQGFLKACPLH